MRQILQVIAIVLLLPVEAIASDCVILLHGLARTELSMSKVDRRLRNAGYHTVNASYPSRKYPIKKLADDTISAALKKCDTASKVSFVTHSLGGILVRQYLAENEISHLDHVVMMAPPNKGSQVVDCLREIPGVKLLQGPVISELGTDKTSVPNSLGPANFSVGIIAGSDTSNLFLSSFLSGPNDGKVSVESTRLDGMRDHITMPVTHSFIMKNNKVIAQTIYFLKNGKFKSDTP